MSDNIMLDVKNLKMYFPIHKGFIQRVIGYVKAVDDVSFSLREGETLGLVGESGCGKTTTGKCILRAIDPTEGEILFKMDEDNLLNIVNFKERQLRKMWKNMQLIFQDPFSSLNPRMTVREIIGEPLLVNKIAAGKGIDKMVADLMRKVGIRPEHMKRYPHAFSGGQRQRIGIARALALNPRLLICDEPVSALDVSIQAQILNLLIDIQKEFGLTYIFIAHDLAVVQHISDRVAVMYVGKIVEIAETEELFLRPMHPYTEALLSAVPKPDPKHEVERIILKGDVADPSNPPKGCYFHPRCSYAQNICRDLHPPLELIKSENGKEHYSACHFADSLSLKGY